MSNELEKRKQTSLQMQVATDIPGFENMDDDLIIVPRMKILQSMSDEVGEDDQFQPGMIINSLSKDILAKKGESIEVVPILIGRSRIRFAPIGSNEGILCRSANGKFGEGEPGGDCSECPFAKWEGSEPPECTDLINVVVVPLGLEDQFPVVLSFGRASFGIGRQFVNMMYMRRKSPWYFKYQIGAKFVKNDKGQFYVPTVKPSGTAPADIIEQMEIIYNSLASAGFEIHEDEEEIKSERAKMAQDNGMAEQPQPQQNKVPDPPF